MSGIVAALYRDRQPVAKQQLSSSIQKLHHRGPNNQDFWINNHIGIGHAQLWTTAKVKSERLPFVKYGGEFVISSDSRLDNHFDLIHKLCLPRNISPGDSELIIYAYEKWGVHCIDHFIGDFAFALWDSKNQLLFCARDHFGVKPFCYFNSSKLFVCASEAKALLCWDEIPSTINKGRIADFFVPQLEGIDNTSTCFEYIHHLPPAHFLIASQDTFKIQQYWQPDTKTEHHFANSNDCYDAFREIFSEAVECRLLGVDKPASMLSGGLDSSSIVALAQKSDRTNQISTFSGISAGNPDCNESWHIKHMISEICVSPHLISVDETLSHIEQLEYLFEHTDNIFDMVMFLPQLMYIAAHQQGYVVLLDGVDGDYVTGQSAHYLSDVIRSGNIGDITQQCRAISHFQPSHGIHYHSSANLFFRALRSMAVPEALRKFRRYITRQKNTQQILENSLLSPECADLVNLKSRLDTHFQSSGLAESRTFREKNAQPIRSPYVSVALERYDRVASAYSIEPRHPFFDKRLVDFCLALSWRERTHAGWSKAILRKSMENSLPQETCWRESNGERLNAVFTQVIIRNLQDKLIDSLRNRTGTLHEFVDPETVEKVIQHYTQLPNIDNTYSLWYLGSANIWLNKYTR